jgi:3-hydroxyacyl-CoA dehydrogenase, NAD binding domain
MNYKNIMVAGTGVLGSQIAFQTAYKGFYVNVYDVSEKVLGHARERLTKLKENYKEDLGATQQAVDEALNRISFYTYLAQAVADADLVVEAIPEVPEIKTAFYKELGRVAPEKTIFTTSLLQKQMHWVARSLRSWHISSKRNTWIRASSAGERDKDFIPTLIPALRARTLYEIDNRVRRPTAPGRKLPPATSCVHTGRLMLASLRYLDTFVKIAGVGSLQSTGST